MGVVVNFLKNPKVIKTGISIIASIGTGVSGFFLGKHMAGKKKQDKTEKK